MPLLDIIVPHYNEPWETGMQFYEMLTLQHGINPSAIRVIIVQDGPDGALPWEECLAPYPFKFKIKTIPHGGVSRARNAGLDMSDAEWVMFCDFDDMFSSVHSIRRFMENLGDDVDLVFSHITGEEGLPETYCLQTYMDNDTFIHGKMFRRQFLIDNNLRFEPDVTFSEDTLFCHVVAVAINHRRKREIPEKLYTRCWNENSTCRNDDNVFTNAVGLFRSRKALCREYYERGCVKNFTGTVIKTVFDYYYATISDGYPNREWFEEDFWQFWQKYKDVFESAPEDLVMYEHDLAFHEALHKAFLSIPSVTFRDWLDRIENKYKGEENNE